MRHALASLLALRAREFSEFYARTSFVLSSCVPRGPTTPTKQGKVGREGMKERVSYALVCLLKLFICYTQGASIKLSPPVGDLTLSFVQAIFLYLTD